MVFQNSVSFIASNVGCRVANSFQRKLKALPWYGFDKIEKLTQLLASPELATLKI
jgi:hypothetical protein